MIWHLVLDYWWVAVWIAAVAAAYVWGGWKLAVAVATLGAAGAIYRQGRKDGESSVRSQQQAKERQDVQTVTQNRSEAERLSASELDRELGKWARRKE